MCWVFMNGLSAFKIRNFACFLLVFLFVCSFVFSKAYAVDVQRVRVGYHEGRGLIADVEAVDQIGYGYEILKKVEQNTNLIFEFIPYTHEEALVALANKRIDLYGPMVATEKRSKEFYYLSTPIGKMQAILASKSGEPIYYNDPQAINNSTIVTTPDNPFLGEFSRYLTQNKINVKFIGGNYDDYHKRQGDYYLTSNTNSHLHNAKNALNIASRDMYFIGNKENVELNREINRALTDIVKHDKNFMERIYLKYFDRINLTKKFLTRDEAIFLKNKRFKVAFTQDHKPIEYVNEQGKPDGISVRILNYLANTYGFEVEYVPYDPSDRGFLRDHFDMLLTIQDDYPTIHEVYNQTATYLRLDMVLMLNVEPGTVFDKKDPIGIGLYNYTTLDYSKIKKEFPRSQIYTYNGILNAFGGYISQDFNAGFFTTTGAEYVQSVLGTDDTQIIGTNIELPLRFFISKKLSQQYVSIFNTIIHHLDEGMINAIESQETLSFLPGSSIMQILQDNLHYIIILILLFLVAVFFFFFFEQRHKRRQIQKIIDTDSITNLISMHRFRELTTEKLKEAEEGEYEIITIDIDYFRVINNIYGFEYGTKTIQAFAKALQAGYKDTDTLIGRVAGELFVVLTKYNSDVNIQAVCYKYIMPMIAKVVGKDYNLSMSIGTYRLNEFDGDVNAIIDRANIARLRGKQFHALTCNAFDEKMQKKAELQTEIVFRMEQALKDREFKVFFQPKIDYQTLKVKGAEALVRWFPKDGGKIYPDEFIPVFEANGFIMELDFYIFEEVTAFIKSNAKHLKVPLISVNLSGRTLMSSSTPYKLMSILKKYQLPPSKIEAEVTESAILDNDKDMGQRVDELKKVGFTVSMDDFGAGVSSLNRLATLNVDTIKLDKSFLDHNSQEKKGSIIVENVVRMAKDLEMKVVSEGVETAEQAKWLKEIGCDLAQGYYFERAMAQDDFIKLLAKNKTYTIDA